MSVPVPMDRIGPWENEHGFNGYLIRAAYAGIFPSENAYQEVRTRAERIYTIYATPSDFYSWRSQDSHYHCAQRTYHQIPGLGICRLVSRVLGIYHCYEILARALPVVQLRMTTWWRKLHGGARLRKALTSLTSLSYVWQC
ncbi:hypothetical protein L228DRAFT_67156 [Xylona heveae TC161]|uniref:Uncharacterized protein n=1 Tax=Xylona heveae (strain CBS 132557 / TC161) TaxID=1328760 RepID=A0A165ISV3_XYLHT|nr:hypothetical protein L228DRAFT_67156 [Xylona heveae TC161]KZF25339.1 hypothetical protein L228DRAFT_67156 [Xylona heveae TC161]